MILQGMDDHVRTARLKRLRQHFTAHSEDMSPISQAGKAMPQVMEPIEGGAATYACERGAMGTRRKQTPQGFRWLLRLADQGAPQSALGSPQTTGQKIMSSCSVHVPPAESPAWQRAKLG